MLLLAWISACGLQLQLGREVVSPLATRAALAAVTALGPPPGVRAYQQRLEAAIGVLAAIDQRPVVYGGLRHDLPNHDLGRQGPERRPLVLEPVARQLRGRFGSFPGLEQPD